MMIGEMVIDYKDLCIRLMKKWKKILVIMIACGLVFGLLGALVGIGRYRKEKEQISKTLDEVKIDNEIELEKLKESLELTDRQVEEAETAVKTYMNLQKNYKDTLKYLENSPRMQMDATNCSFLRMRFYVDSSQQIVYPVISDQDYTTDIVNSFSAQIKSNENIKKIMDTLQIEIDHNYSPELIYVYISGTDIMTIEMYCESRERCEEAAEVISDIIEQSYPEIQEQFGEFGITDLGSDYFENVLNTSLLDEQQSQYSYLNNIKSSLSTVASSLSSSQKEYYEQILDFDVKERNKLSEETELKCDLINKKYIVLGAALGAFLYCLCFVLNYFTSSTLRVNTDLTDLYGVPVLAVIEKKAGKKSGSPDLLQEKLKLICAEVNVCMEKQNLKNVLLTGTENIADNQDFIASLCAQMESKGINASYTSSIAGSADAMDKLLSADAVVMIEKIDVSRYENIKKSVFLCRQNNIPIVGGVVLG